MDGYEFKRLNSLHNRPLLLLQGDDWYSNATASFLRPRQPQDPTGAQQPAGSAADYCAAPRTSASSGCCRFCEQLYAEWGIQQPDVNCEYLTTALQVVCGTERKLAVRRGSPATAAEEHHTTVAAVDCGMRRLIDGVKESNTEAWQFKQIHLDGRSGYPRASWSAAGRQKLIDSGTQGRKAGR